MGAPQGSEKLLNVECTYLADSKPLSSFEEAAPNAHDVLVHLMRVGAAGDGEVGVFACSEKPDTASVAFINNC